MLSYIHAYHAENIPYFLVLHKDSFSTVYSIVHRISL
jgi:hypothetical protein